MSGNNSTDQTETPNQPILEIIKLQNLLDNNLLDNNTLTIPSYQRPYKWTEEHVVQLLEDIFEHTLLKNKVFRIGNIILHYENGNDNIVDGQQRLTTISLLLHVLDNGFQGLLLKQEYKHNISKNNIAYNNRIIEKWVENKINDRIEFKNVILDKCEFVLFTVFKQDEAFQLFDSQNTRGKTLEPYDLLKAFHLREMSDESNEEINKCVKRWEEAIDKNTLKPILNNHLFRVRKWCKNEDHYSFTTKEIGEFKGITVREQQQYPYERKTRIIDSIVNNYQKDTILINSQTVLNFPFQITDTIINGKRFFEYVDNYITQRNILFDLDEKVCNEDAVQEFKDFFKEYCLYGESTRTGDARVRNLYENILLLFIDKFGFVEEFEAFYKAFYRYAYQIRCDKGRISVATILNSPVRKIFNEITNSNSPEALKHYQYKTYNVESDENKNVTGINNMVKFIKAKEEED